MWWRREAGVLLWGCEAHLLPGRLRVAVPGLRGSRERAGALAGRLAGCPGVRKATANPDTGRVLIHFDPGRVTLAELGQRLGLPGGQGAPVPQGPAPGGQQVVLTGAALLGVGLKRLLFGPGAIARSMRAYDLAGLITVIGSYPYLRRGMARLVNRGRISGDLVIGLVGLVATILRENLVGLAALFVSSLSQWLLTRTVADCTCQAARLGPGPCQPRPVRHSALLSEAGERWTGRWGAWSAGAAAVTGALTGDWRRALATLIAAAPSAVQLGTSLPLSIAAVAAARQGVLIRHAEAMAAAARADLTLVSEAGSPAQAERVRQARAAGRTVAVIAVPGAEGWEAGQGGRTTEQGQAGLAAALGAGDLAILAGPAPSLVHAADVILLDPDPRQALAFLALGRRAARLGRQNRALAAGLNLAGLCLAATGLTGPLGATLWHNLTTLVVQCNAARLLPRSERCKTLPPGPYWKGKRIL